MADGFFISRDTELKQMENILLNNSNYSTRKVLILGGMGGIGKTQLAITYAKRHYTSYSSVFWLNAAFESTLNSSLRDVANRILPPETVSKLDDDQLRIQVSNWLSELDNTRWLLIFDNYDDPDQYTLTKYYPSVAHGSIIITTRQPRRINGELVKVESMTQASDGLAILATRSQRQAIQSGRNHPQNSDAIVY
jgi:NB-ARC domain